MYLSSCFNTDFICRSNNPIWPLASFFAAQCCCYTCAAEHVDVCDLKIYRYLLSAVPFFSLLWYTELFTSEIASLVPSKRWDIRRAVERHLLYTGLGCEEERHDVAVIRRATKQLAFRGAYGASSHCIYLQHQTEQTIITIPVNSRREILRPCHGPSPPPPPKSFT